jgi:hypothetical protein
LPRSGPSVARGIQIGDRHRSRIRRTAFRPGQIEHAAALRQHQQQRGHPDNKSQQAIHRPPV